MTADERWLDAKSLVEQDAVELNNQLIDACGMVSSLTDHIAPFVALALLEQREDDRREIERLRYHLGEIMAGVASGGWVERECQEALSVR